MSTINKLFLVLVLVTISVLKPLIIPQNLPHLANIHSDYLYTGKSGVNSNSDILVGRPKGGVAILYKKSVAKYIKCVDISSDRVCGVIIHTLHGFNILVVCTYMPCDTYSNTYVNHIFVDTLNIIEHTLNAHNCNAYIICGDLNTSFHRDNAQTRCVSEFMTRN